MEIIHSFLENSVPDIKIVYSQVDSEEYAWICRQEWIAGVAEVRHGEADHVGDVMCSHIFLIQFCPFCGQQLGKQ